MPGLPVLLFPLHTERIALENGSDSLLDVPLLLLCFSIVSRKKDFLVIILYLFCRTVLGSCAILLSPEPDGHVLSKCPDAYIFSCTIIQSIMVILTFTLMTFKVAPLCVSAQFLQ